MKYKLDIDTDIYFNGSHQLEIQKGIWNREEVLIELDADDLKDESMQIFLKKLEGREEIDEDRCSEKMTKELFVYLKENGFIQKQIEKKNISEVLKEKKILLVITEEFAEVKKNVMYGDIEAEDFEEFLENIGIDKLINLDLIDAYEYEVLFREAKEYLMDYREISFLLKNPNVEKLKLIAKILNDMEKITSYTIIDNGLLFSFTCIPCETACFNCFDLRIKARTGTTSKKYVCQKKEKVYGKNQSEAYKNNIELCFIFDFVIKVLADENTYKTRCNVGKVMIFNLNTFELTSENLYKVPFCEGCQTW